MSEIRLSISTVAAAAGVSAATVSRVMNGLPGVREDTVAQVRAAIKDLGYVRQRARTVRRSVPAAVSKIKTGNIAAITIGEGQSWFEFPVIASVFAGIQRGASSHGLRLLMGEIPNLDQPSTLVADRQIDGAIIFVSSSVSTSELERVIAHLQHYVPVVWAMNVGNPATGVDHVAPDNVGIGQLAYHHLSQASCKKMAFLTANPRWPLMRLRGQSFLNCAMDDDVSTTVYAVTENGRDDSVRAYGGRVVKAGSLQELAVAIAKDAGRPDGLFIGNDLTTSTIYPMLAAQGIVPDRDLRIISCDAEEARLASLQPRPASIDIGAQEIGIRSVNRLINRIQRPSGPPLIIHVAPRIVLPTSAK